MEAGTSKDPKMKKPQYQPKYKKGPKAEAYKQYLGSQDAGQGFADKRKRKAAYDYIKLLQKEKKRNEVTGNEASLHEHKSFKNVFNKDGHKDQKVHSFWKAEKMARERQKKKEIDKERCQTEKAEKGKALEAYSTKKKAQHLKLCKRTRKGQPVMKLQMEVLLDKIKKQKS